MRVSELRFLGITVAFCAFLLLFSSADAADSSESVPSESSDLWLERQLHERSRLYIESIGVRSDKLTLKQRAQWKKQAQIVVQRGMAKLSHSSELVRQRKLGATDPAYVFESLRNLSDSLPNQKVASFLNCHFQQPSELDVAVCVALPSVFHRVKRQTALVAHLPFDDADAGLYRFGAPGCGNVIVLPSLPRDGKTLALVLGQKTISLFSSHGGDFRCRFFEDENLLSGFPQIAQTIVLRI